VTLSEAKGLSSSKPRYFAEHVLSGAEELSMICAVFMLNWYYLMVACRIASDLWRIYAHLRHLPAIAGRCQSSGSSATLLTGTGTTSIIVIML
ncbi:MAG: hypothetical protein MI924_37830, partial [Chloroflexales bacterium]|nr:hypothetical protein [Chloroflexales bacterium]